MDDKLKNFLEGKEDELPKDEPLKEVRKEEKSNPYDKFFEEDGAADKIKDGLEKTGEFIKDSLKETGEFLGESLKETGRFFKEGSEEASKILKEDVLPKAKEAKEKLDEKVDDWTAKLKEYSEKPIEKTPGSGLDESLMDTHSGFFDKMEKLADKLDKEDESTPPEGTLKITETEVKKKEDSSKIYGFDDIDGDGDELIDDAIIED